MSDKKFQIIGSLTSPYTRMVRVLCEELSLPYELLQTAPFGKNTEQQLSLIRAHNPLGKVPSLIFPEGEELFDSRVIANYLLQNATKHAKPDFHIQHPFSFEAENFCSVVYGAIDAGIMRFMLTKNDPSIDIQRGYMPRFHEILATGLDWIEQYLAKKNLPGGFSFLHIVLLCGLEWFDKRNIYDTSHLSNLRNLHKKFEARPSLEKTKIPKDI